MGDVSYNLGSSYQVIRPDAVPTIDDPGPLTLAQGADLPDDLITRNAAGKVVSYNVDKTLNAFNKDTPGTYIVKYKVTDLMGREVELSRTVIVQSPPAPPSSAPTTEQTTSVSASISNIGSSTGLTLGTNGRFTGTGSMSDADLLPVADLTLVPDVAALQPVTPPASLSDWGAGKTRSFDFYRSFTNPPSTPAYVEISYDHTNNISGAFMLTNNIGVMFTDVTHNGTDQATNLAIVGRTSGPAAEVHWDVSDAATAQYDTTSYVWFGDIRINMNKTPREIVDALIAAKASQDDSGSGKTWDFIIIKTS